MCDHNTVNNGLTMAVGPVLHKEKYVSVPKAMVAQTTGPECMLDEGTVAATLLNMFSLLNIEKDDIVSRIQPTKIKAIDIAISRAETVKSNFSRP